MTTPTPVRTLYALVDYTDHTGHAHTRGTAVQYPVTDRQASELLRRGVLGSRPPRRQPGEAVRT